VRDFSREPVKRGYIRENKKKPIPNKHSEKGEWCDPEKITKVKTQQVHRQVHCLRGQGTKSKKRRQNKAEFMYEPWRGSFRAGPADDSFRPIFRFARAYCFVRGSKG